MSTRCSVTGLPGTSANARRENPHGHGTGAMASKSATTGAAVGVAGMVVVLPGRCRPGRPLGTARGRRLNARMTLAFDPLPAVDSPIARLDPRWKLAALVVAAAAVAAVQSPAPAVSAFVAALGLA